MVTTDEVRSVVIEAIDDLNGSLPPERRLDSGTDTVLLGSGSRLDSLGLVNLIMSIEQLIEERYGQAVTLADERALSQKSSPFRTVGTLTEYTAGLLQEPSANA